MALITSRQNPKIKLIRTLSSRKKRNATGLFVVEGIRHVGEAFESGASIDFVLHAPDLLSSDFANQLVTSLKLINVPVYQTTAELFSDLAGKDHPQGIMAVMNQKVTALNQLNAENCSFGVAIESPQDPGNLGTILRTLDAAGGDALVLLGRGTDIYHPTAVRASMGALFWKPVIRTSLEKFKSWVDQNEISLVGSSADGDVDYRLMETSEPFVLLLGNEQKGLSDEAKGMCESVVNLPMRGRTTSLNLSVAAGILIYELIRKRNL